MTGPDRAEVAQGVPGDKPAQGDDAASRPPGGDGRPLIRAAQYIRMSTEHQQYSTENQSDVIREYAKKRGYEIVRTYTDAGKSGLRIEGPLADAAFQIPTRARRQPGRTRQWDGKQESFAVERWSNRTFGKIPCQQTRFPGAGGGVLPHAGP